MPLMSNPFRAFTLTSINNILRTKISLPAVFGRISGRVRLSNAQDIANLPSYRRLVSAIRDSYKKNTSDKALKQIILLLDEQEAAAKARQLKMADFIQASLNICIRWIETVNIQNELGDDLYEFTHDVLKKTPFHGDYLQKSQELKQRLLMNSVDLELLDSLRSLVVSNSVSLHQESEGIREYLQDVKSRISSIFVSIKEQDEGLREIHASRSRANEKLEQSAQSMISMLDSPVDVVQLKNSLSQQLHEIDVHLKEERQLADKQNDAVKRTIDLLKSRVNHLEKESSRLRADLLKKHEQLLRDPLTGLFNRVAYNRAIEQAADGWHVDATPATLMVWDIDHFKSINDRYGHAVGDRVLVTIGKKLLEGCKQSDVVARIGGEEFVILLNNTDVESAKVLAEKIRQRIEQVKFTIEQRPVSVTASCGLATFQRGDTPDSVFDRADQALYKAKASGRNRILELLSAA